MSYIAGDGSLVDSRPRSLLSLSTIPELFWEAVNFITLFFRTMIDPSVTSRGSNYTATYRPGGSARPGAPQRRIGRIGGGAGSPGCPPMAGGG